MLPHKDLSADAPIMGTLKIQGEYRVPYDLNPGDRIRIVVQSEDGEVLDTQEAEIGPIALLPVTIDDIPFGTERAHKAKLVG